MENIIEIVTKHWYEFKVCCFYIDKITLHRYICLTDDRILRIEYRAIQSDYEISKVEYDIYHDYSWKLKKLLSKCITINQN